MSDGAVQYKVAEAAVEFIKQGQVAAKIQGKIVTTEKKYDYNSLVVGNDASGRQVLMALQFGEKNVRIVIE